MLSRSLTVFELYDSEYILINSLIGNFHIYMDIYIYELTKYIVATTCW